MANYNYMLSRAITNFVSQNRVVKNLPVATFEKAEQIFSNPAVTKWNPFTNCETRFKNIKDIFFSKDKYGQIVKNVVKKDGTVITARPMQGSKHRVGSMDIKTEKGRVLSEWCPKYVTEEEISKGNNRYIHIFDSRGNELGYMYEPNYNLCLGEKDKYNSVIMLGKPPMTYSQSSKDLFYSLKAYILEN